MKAPIIEVRDLSFRIGEKWLLRDIEVSLESGQVLGVIGPNGAGKSTLLKCVAGEHKVTHGSLFSGGKPLAEDQRARIARWRAVLPQMNPIPFAFLAREIVFLGRSPHIIGRETARDREIVEEALAVTDAAHLADRSVQTLSGGELQRVHLARVLAQIWTPDPEHGRLLLLDEPTSALDLKHQHALLRLVRNWADEGTAVLVVLHDLNLAARYADTLLWLYQGKQIDLGTPAATLSPERIREVFEVEALIHQSPRASPFVQVVD